MTTPPTATPTPPGALACQRDSSLRRLVTRVHACEPVSVADASPRAFDLELLDTVLFPEGGGQPCDTGRLNDTHAITAVVVRGGRVLHRLVLEDAAIAPPGVGDEVTVTVDWARRLDHMQQHSGQHLLSAICERHGLETTTWSLGEERCNVELVPATPTTTKPAILPMTLLRRIENEVNDAILGDAAMTPTFVTRGTPEWERVAQRCKLSDATDGDDDTNGTRKTLRVVVIDGLDANPCCGTHVPRLGQLQSLRILHAEFARGATRVWFVVGNRVNREFNRMLEREQQLTRLLSCGPDDHAARVDKLQQAQRAATKEIKALQKDVAAATARDLRAQSHNGARVVSYHRPGGDLPFLQAVVANITTEKDSTVFVLTAGDSRGSGSFLLAGPSRLLSEHGKSVIEVIDGKGGGGRGGILQGKANKLERTPSLIERIQGLHLAA